MIQGEKTKQRSKKVVADDYTAEADKEPQRARTICKVQDFTLSFPMDGRLCPAVDDLSFEIREGEMAALIGESGCGKYASRQPAYPSQLVNHF